MNEINFVLDKINNKNPLHITFVLKNDDEISGYTNSTNKKKSLNNARLDTLRDTYWMCMYIK